ncbi:hypothetical protein [Flavilitoribacter nigricans]|uniref:hypothetical protein n=1 Tax=Flavilitoribacter nigricans TaxID=70997 RepID=UPI001626AB89|nr:hypothetical protein [Flavilitoribacter nigricans]
MLNRFANPKSMTGVWLALGIALGISFSYALGNLAIGLPMGMALSFWAGKVTYRVSRGLLRIRR